MKRRPGGFTLVEIMVALGVFALVSVSVYARIGDILSETRELELRTLATWVAQNRMTALVLEQRGASEAPGAGRRSDRVTLGGRAWRVITEIEATSSEDFRRVEISVGEDDEGGGEARSTAVLVAFLGAN